MKTMHLVISNEKNSYKTTLYNIYINHALSSAPFVTLSLKSTRSSVVLYCVKLSTLSATLSVIHKIPVHYIITIQNKLHVIIRLASFIDCVLNSNLHFHFAQRFLNSRYIIRV